MCKFKQIGGMIAIHALMLLGAATAWAGRGDVDPNYGEGGKVSAGTLLALPGDRLAIPFHHTDVGQRAPAVPDAGLRGHRRSEDADHRSR